MIEVLIFSLKALIIVLSVGAIALLIAMLATKAGQKNELSVEPLHKKHKDLGQFLKSFMVSKEDWKKTRKKEKKQEKLEKKKEKTAPFSSLPKKNVFVLNFKGDIHASQVDHLREEITAVLLSASKEDEVVVKVESPGGIVHGYGLAAAELLRIRDKGIKLIVCVDQVAASGGYMMACVANEVIAAPFAILGSIGVVAQVPNFNRVLKKYDVDYKEYTAGEYKRTVSLFGEITPKGEERFRERLVDTHVLFKSFVHRFRPQIELDKVATGEYWFGEECLKLGLADRLMTSDDYLMSFPQGTQIFELKYEIKKNLSDKLSGILGSAIEKAVVQIATAAQSSNMQIK
jgi:serine protease SohB